ncbi:MAG: hypothetical protein WD533_04375 [Dehalococcoidia bacterium]
MTLGNVGRASSSDFEGKRKVLLLPFVIATREDQELQDLVLKYWEEAMDQVRKLETSFGPVRHLFHEGSVGQDDKAVQALEQGNPAGFPYLKRAIDDGAKLEETEDPAALSETLDLHRCLAVVQSSQEVMHRLVEWFEQSRKRRYAAIGQRVETAVAPNSVALLVISPDHEVRFPKDIEVVYIVPPVLDQINRWMREHRMDEASPAEETEPQPDAQE